MFSIETLCIDNNNSPGNGALFFYLTRTIRICQEFVIRKKFRASHVTLNYRYLLLVPTAPMAQALRGDLGEENK